MENTAHTLLGLTLAKAGLERVTPLATTAIVVSSNMLDVDVFTHWPGDAVGYLEHHRGITHTFIGIPVLAAVLTLILLFIDRRFRLRRDPFRRPVRPWRIFWLSCLGGLGHLFMDFTNTYGVRPLLPFDGRWFYGDLAFIVDPWMWLILGGACAWLTMRSGAMVLFWTALGTAMGLIMATALNEANDHFPLTIPLEARIVWFIGLAVVVAGAFLRWGRSGEKVARYALLLLCIYYSGLWMAQQSAIRAAASDPPGPDAITPVAWPTPVLPTRWHVVTATADATHTRYVNLPDSGGQWTSLPRINGHFIEALRQSPEARTYLSFIRFTEGRVEERQDGYLIELRDLRFSLQLTAMLDQQMTVTSVNTRWY